MGRKRNQGKTRRAAKAKAKQEAEERRNNNQTIDERRQQLPLVGGQMQLMQSDNDNDNEKCMHGVDDPTTASEAEGISICSQFVTAFYGSFEAAKKRNDSLSRCLTAARNATLWGYAAAAVVWCDSAKMKIVLSYFLCLGTQAILDGDDDNAKMSATLARYLEQHIAVELEKTQALPHFPKLGETYEADMHTLVKFFRRRIPCSCLDDKYEEVKDAAKMGFCYNKQCNIPERRVERSNTKYCSRCRSVTYCSRECQVAHWHMHKPDCDSMAKKIEEFKARQQK